MSGQVLFSLNVFGNRDYELEVCDLERSRSFKGNLSHLREPHTAAIIKFGVWLLSIPGDILEDLELIIELIESRGGPRP